MKKTFLILGLLFCFNSLGFAQEGQYQEETLVRAEATQERFLLCGTKDNPVRIAGYMNYPPFGWKETFTDGSDVFASYKGVGMVLFEKFAKEYNLEYQHVNMLNYDEAKYAFSRGYIDILLNNYFDTDTYSRTGYLYPGYIQNPIIIVVRKEKEDTPVPETLEDLRGKKGLIRAEENLYNMLYPKIPSGVKVDKVNGVRRAFQSLLRKEVDFLIMSQFAYETEVRRFKIKEFLTTSTKPIMAPVVFFSYIPGNPCAMFIKDAFEKKLKEYTSNPNLIRTSLTSQMITWENKFMKEKSLMYDIDVVEEEKVEKSEDLDAWLQQQNEKKASQ